MSKYNNLGELLEDIFKRMYNGEKGVKKQGFRLRQREYNAWGYAYRTKGGKVRYNITVMEKGGDNGNTA